MYYTLAEETRLRAQLFGGKRRVVRFNQGGGAGWRNGRPLEDWR